MLTGRNSCFLSPSSSSESEDEPTGLRPGAYASLELGTALAEPEGGNYVRAAQELAAIVAALPRVSLAVRKDAAGQVMADALLAVEKCDGRARCTQALARLVAACGKQPHLPHQRVRRLQREHKRAAVALARGSRLPAEGALPPGRFLDLPRGCMEQVFSCLGPLELAACACVCCEWRAALASPAALPLWSRHLKWTFPRPEPPRLGCTLAPGYENLSALADDRDRFYALAAALPWRLKCYRHNRVMHRGTRRVGWRRGAASGAAVKAFFKPLDLDEVVEYLFHDQLPMCS